MKHFSPFWLNNQISSKDKGEVQEFLTSNGIELKNCSGFVYMGDSGPMSCFAAYMYKLNAQGQPQWNRDKDEAEMDDDIEFWVKTSEIPDVLRKALVSA